MTWPAAWGAAEGTAFLAGGGAIAVAPLAVFVWTGAPAAGPGTSADSEPVRTAALLGGTAAAATSEPLLGTAAGPAFTVAAVGAASGAVPAVSVGTWPGSVGA